MTGEKPTNAEEPIEESKAPAEGGEAASHVKKMAAGWQTDVLINIAEQVTLTPEDKKERKRVHRLVLKRLDSIFAEAGFKRKGLIWRREMGDFVHVVTLSRVKVRGKKYIKYVLSVNAMIKELSPDKENPEDKDCHYKGHFSTIGGCDDSDLDFDDKSKSENEKLESLSGTLEEKIFPFLDGFDSVDDIDAESFEENTRIRRILTEVQAKHAINE